MNRIVVLQRSLLFEKKSVMDTYNKTLNDKLNTLLNLLEQSKQEYEAKERSIQDQELKRILSQLIEENTTYANQLLSTLDCREVKKNFHFARQYNCLPNEADEKMRLCKECILEKCLKSETIFECAYQDVLNSWFIQNSLRKMLERQLNETKCLLMKVRVKYLTNNKIFKPHYFHGKY